MKRRRYLSSIASLSSIMLAGCSKNPKSPSSTPSNSSNSRGGGEYSLVTSGREKLVEYDRDTLVEKQINGGVPKDGIPSIDDPKFAGSDGYEYNVFTDNIVFGVQLNGETKAYPRNILTKHEIVNDVIGGENVAVTYCPLTGTVLGFKRGGTTFGVSGNLINNNLVMYDRESDSRWPQMLGTAISGPHKGEFLEEFRVVWTTWDNWVGKHPDTKVLTTETGYLKDYSSGAYGGYQPRTGYFKPSEPPLFPSLSESDEYLPKEVFFGGRTADAAYSVKKTYLKSEKHIKFDNIHVFYDKTLDTGYIYEQSDETVEWNDGTVIVNGKEYTVDALPLRRINSYDAMWFAWNGYYPSSAVKPN